MKFNKKYHYMYLKRECNLPLEYRKGFEEWWEMLGRNVDRDNKETNQEIKKSIKIVKENDIKVKTIIKKLKKIL